MKLELKHIAPYAPYGIKVLLGDIRELTAISLDSKYVFLTTHIGSRQKQMADIEKIKPLLRKKEYLFNLQNEIAIRWGGGLNEKAKLKWLEEVTDEMINTAYVALRYDFVEFMLENHIDVFGLVDSGLAVKMD